MPTSNTVSIIIPVYNEQRTVSEVIEQVLALRLPGWKKEIIVVNDGSTDATAKVVKRYPVRGYTHRSRRGKGSALVTGVSHAHGSIVIFQDADLEYHTTDIAALLRAYAKTGGIVYGSRRLSNNPFYSRLYVYGAYILTLLVNIRFGTHLTDVFTGYKLLPVEIFRSLHLTSNGFEIEMEMTAKLLKSGYQIHEIPVQYSPRGHGEGKKLWVFDGVKALHTFLKHAIL